MSSSLLTKHRVHCVTPGVKWAGVNQLRFCLLQSNCEGVSAVLASYLLRLKLIISAAAPTLQSLHAVQLGEKLVDHAVGDPCAVVTPPGCQGLELIKEEDAGFGSLSPETHRSSSEPGHR